MSRSLLSSVFSHRCPSCRQGKLFTNSNPYRLREMASMYDKCPSCGQSYLPEPGFFYGSMYVSYGVTVAIFIATVVVMNFIYDPGLWDMIIAISVVLFLVTPVVFRLSRSIWAHMFIKFKSNKSD